MRRLGQYRDGRRLAQAATARRSSGVASSRGADRCAAFWCGYGLLRLWGSPPARPTLNVSTRCGRVRRCTTVPPGPLIRSINYSFTPDERYRLARPGGSVRRLCLGAWQRAQRHGRLRGLEPPPHVRWLNDAGYDVVRFDRSPMVDDASARSRMARDGLARLRQAGYARVIVGGQSRGAWNSLQVLDTPGLADAVVAISPAAHGSGASLNLLGQTDDFRQLLASGVPQRAQIVVRAVQAGRLYRRRRTRAGECWSRGCGRRSRTLLVIDRPDGFAGHGAGNTAAFGDATATASCSSSPGRARPCLPHAERVRNDAQSADAEQDNRLASIPNAIE